MKIGIPKEIKDRENRVALTPDGVRTLADQGHAVFVETGAGLGSGFSDQEYLQAGAKAVSAAEAWATDLVIKVKEPLPAEYRYLTGQMLFTFFHLAGVEPGLTDVLLASKTTAIAYETLEDAQQKLPVLAPMSAVAGNMATLMGGYYLARFNQGRGVQLGTVIGRQYGKVVVIGNGVVGRHAAHVASSMGAETHMAGLRRREDPLALEMDIANVQFFLSNEENISAHLQDADLVVGAVLKRGARAPHVVTEAMVRQMPEGSVIVDVSIDQGGCVETSQPTSHSDPVFIRHGVLHYCVTNMPGAYPRTSTMALSEASLSYALRLSNEGLSCLMDDPGLAKAVNTYQGYLTCLPVAEALAREQQYRSLQELL